MAETGFIARNYVNYRDGKREISGGYQMLFTQMHNTYLDYVLNIRQKYSEEIFRASYEARGGIMLEGTELLELIHDPAAPDGYAVTAVTKDVVSGAVGRVQCKYVVGADGTRSTVRRLSGIPFVGDDSALKWFRIDAIVKTNMPDPRILRSAANFATATDDPEDSIRHGVADSFRAQKNIFLAGDAGHCHSSGTAQGMNTGVHDALNLAWKLGGVLCGWYDESILDTYEEERRPEAQRVIDQDKTISSLITGKIPEVLAKPGANPFQALYQFTASTMQFTLGLGINYRPSVLNRPGRVGLVTSGWRGPDALLQRPGSRCPVRLFQVTKNLGKFQILVFTGNPASTRHKLLNLRSYLDSEAGFVTRFPDVANFLTIIPGNASQADEYLGVEKFGQAFYDVDGGAATKYGFYLGGGGLAVLRPDGILAFAAQLDQGAEVGNYFEQFAKPASKPIVDSDGVELVASETKEVELDMETTV
ncbi:hypothetical protein BHE90_008803 [Fusarium euwallaceae]|uniref:FAD-binding domain-containing protein n=2 Tax=Fusarium solani species complex TaxID=232080 RepID=A0A430LLY9_9HYPO|nr:hypothetical protein CDV31_007027 [Fusarium ambrosium]RTE76742.1 hypothetical protein BHE90_008803 [Fusarium euwallaceae]